MSATSGLGGRERTAEKEERLQQQKDDPKNKHMLVCDLQALKVGLRLLPACCSGCSPARPLPRAPHQGACAAGRPEGNACVCPFILCRLATCLGYYPS